MSSSIAFDPESGSEFASCTSNSRVLTIRYATFSGEMESVGMARSSEEGTRADWPRLREKSALRNRLFQFREPNVRGAIRRRAPVAARRQRTAGRDLGAVGQRRALELVGEEAPQ